NFVMSVADAPRLPATFNRLAWSNLAAQSAEQIALAAAPIVAVLLLGVGEGRNPAADLVGSNDAATAFAARLHRGLRNGRLQRRRACAGTVAGDLATTARGERADRTGAHDRVRQ